MDTQDATLDLELVARLRLLVVRLERRIRQQAQIDLTPSQLSALAVIERKGPLRLGELAKRERISKPSVTRLVDKLEARAYLRITQDPFDRRASVVAITTLGQSLLNESRSRIDAFLAQAMTKIDLSDQRRIFDAVPALEILLDESK